MAKPKLHEWKTSTGKSRHLLDPKDQGDLERDSAIYEFVHRHGQEDAEDLAFTDYRKKHHMAAASHHYAAMRAANSSGDAEVAKKHKLLYDMHLKATGKDPNEPVPDEIRTYMDDPKRDPIMRFKNHPADHYVMGDFGKSEVEWLDHRSQIIDDAVEELAKKEAELRTLGEWHRRNGEPEKDIVKLYRKLKPSALAQIHGNLTRAARRQIRDHGTIKDAALATHVAAAHHVALLRRFGEFTSTLNKGDLIPFKRPEGPNADRGVDAEVEQIDDGINRVATQHYLDTNHLHPRSVHGGKVLQHVAKIRVAARRTAFKAQTAKDMIEAGFVPPDPGLFKNADESVGTLYQPTCPVCEDQSGLSRHKKYPNILFCSKCNNWFQPEHTTLPKKDAIQEEKTELSEAGKVIKSALKGLILGAVLEKAQSMKLNPNEIKVRDEGIRRGHLPPGAPGADKYGAGVQADKKKKKDKEAARKWRPGKDD